MTQGKITLFQTGALACPGLGPSEPLWKRVPTVDSEGRRLSDFMVLIPKLRSWSPKKMDNTVREIQAVFTRYSDAVVFADLNLNLNLLWISVKPIPGIHLELAGALRARIPEAVLVANQVEAMVGARRRGWW